jgi:hypothetical protein
LGLQHRDGKSRRKVQQVPPTNSTSPATVEAEADTTSVFDWRKYLPVHPAAELFPLMPPAELQALAEDILKNGLRARIVLWSEAVLDGRHRLDALALLGLLCVDKQGRLATNKLWNGLQWVTDDGPRELRFERIEGGGRVELPSSFDPYALALSYNAHRRHLTPEQKRELIAKLVKAKPDVSDRQLGKMAKASKNTVASVRTDLESPGQLDHVDKRTDAKGRKQPAKKSGSKPKAKLSASYERDRKACIALDQKVKDAEREVAQHKAAVSAKDAAPPPYWNDAALDQFDAHILELAYQTKEAKPQDFLKTAASTRDLYKLAVFLTELVALKKMTAAAIGESRLIPAGNGVSVDASTEAMKAKLAKLEPPTSETAAPPPVS